MKQNGLLIHLSKKGTSQVNKTTNVKSQNDAVILGILFQYNTKTDKWQINQNMTFIRLSIKNP